MHFINIAVFWWNIFNESTAKLVIDNDVCEKLQFQLTFNQGLRWANLPNILGLSRVSKVIDRYQQQKRKWNKEYDETRSVFYIRYNS